MQKVIGQPEETMVIRCDGQILAWVWRGRLHTAGIALASWQDGRGKEWHRIADQGSTTFVLGRDHAGWKAMPWPPKPELYALPMPERAAPVPKRTRRKAQ